MRGGFSGSFFHDLILSVEIVWGPGCRRSILSDGGEINCAARTFRPSIALMAVAASGYGRSSRPSKTTFEPLASAAFAVRAYQCDKRG